jgi:hypothetical protein
LEEAVRRARRLPRVEFVEREYPICRRVVVTRPIRQALGESIILNQSKYVTTWMDTVRSKVINNMIVYDESFLRQATIIRADLHCTSSILLVHILVQNA